MERHNTTQRDEFRQRIRADTNPESSNKLGAARNSRIVQIQKELLIWGEMLVALGWFTGERAANRKLYQLAEDKQIQRVGAFVFRKNGKKKRGHPATLYGPLPGKKLEHQVVISQLFAAFHPSGWTVGSKCKYLEDITMLLDGRFFRFEVDMDTERKPRVLDRLSKYAGCTDPIAYVTTDTKRVKQLRDWAAEMPHVRSLVMFGVIDEVLADPYGREQPVFQNIDGTWLDVFPNGADPDGLCGTPTAGT